MARVTQNNGPEHGRRNLRKRLVYGDLFARIGETGEQNLEWLIQFTAKPLRKLNLDERIELLWEVHAFCLLTSDAPWRIKKEEVMNFDFAAVVEPHTFNKRWREVESLQPIVTEALIACVKRQPLKLPRLRIQLQIDFSRWTQNDPKPSPSSSPFFFIPPIRIDENIDPAFIFRLAQVINTDGDRITQCQSDHCSRPSRLFIRSKSDQQFCSNTCRSREAMKRWRKDQAKVKREKATKGGQHGSKRR
jgi:hypothetical protein